MFQRSGPWLYVASGAALGLVAWGARARLLRRRTRDEVSLPPTYAGSPRDGQESPSPTKTDRTTKRLRSAAQHRNLTEPAEPMRESIGASTGSQAQQRPGRANVAQSYPARSERTGLTQAREREASSLVSPIALASAVAQAGSPHRQPSDQEVQRKHSAVPEQASPNTHETSTHEEAKGTAPRNYAVTSHAHQTKTSYQKQSDADVPLTARPSDDAVSIDDAYDAVAPDDLGTEWLNRAIESATIDRNMSPREAIGPDYLLDSAMAGVSEGSVNAANAERLEETASAKLEAALDTDDWETPPDRSDPR